MKLLGNRVLVSKIEEEKKEGFQTIEVQDSFVNKGRVEEISLTTPGLTVGDMILFSKYSPDTQEIDYDGKKMKIVNFDDILAVL